MYANMMYNTEIKLEQVLIRVKVNSSLDWFIRRYSATQLPFATILDILLPFVHLSQSPPTVQTRLSSSVRLGLWVISVGNPRLGPHRSVLSGQDGHCEKWGE
jgi:hypothetical protein